MKAYKGFNKDMTCNGFQYEEGKTYHEDKAVLCECGFHACKNPLECLAYYNPAHSVYHEVEIDDCTEEAYLESKICGKTIKIGAKLSLAKIVDLSIDFVKSKCEKFNTSTGNFLVNTSKGDFSVNISEGKHSVNTSRCDRSVNTSEGWCSINISQGNRSVNTSKGNRPVNISNDCCSVNTSDGDRSVNTSKGYHSVNTSKGFRSVNVSENYCSVNTSEGNYSINISGGERSVNISEGKHSVNTSNGVCSVNNSEGECSVNVSIGLESKNIASKGSVSVGWGKYNRCKGDIGSYILLVERGEWDGHFYEQIGEPKLGKIDGITLKPDTWYTLRNGEFVECEDEKMIETKTDPNGCVGCNTDGRCIGFSSCRHCQVTTVYCDGCGEEISDGYECNGEQLCRDCAEVLFDDILSEEGLLDNTPIDEKAELCGAEWTVF